MKNYDVVIVGGSAAGLTVAMTARKFYPKKKILMIRDKENIPIPCGIPYVFGTVGDPMQNLIPVDKLLETNNIDSMIDKVVKLNREFKIAFTKSGEDFNYKKLVFATGSKPITPPIEGIDLDNIYPIQKDTAHLESIENQLDKAKDLVIVGGGFIGVEMAEECKKHDPDINVSIVELENHCLGTVYDTDVCLDVEDELKEQGINLLTSTGADKFIGDKNVEEIVLQDGKHLKADMVILGLGSRPNSDLAKKSDLEIGPFDGIAVNKYMRTSDESIFACGDCSEKFSFFDGSPSNLRLASIATMEARIVGANLFTTKRINSGTVGCFSTCVNNKAFAATGLTAQEASKRGYRYVVGEAKAVNRHPGLMPGSKPLSVKLIFEKASGIILGAQMHGAKSAGELINAASAFISKRMTAEEIAMFQAATHPALTASPIAYQLVNAAEDAVIKNSRNR